VGHARLGADQAPDHEREQRDCRATGDDRAVNTFEVTISDLKQLTDLMRTIERLQGVYSVERS
jgi:GTP pyrophosphokinase